MSKMSMSEAGRLGAKASKLTSTKQKTIRIQLYSENPLRCPQCSCALSYEDKLSRKKFCSQSCAAKFNNSKRSPGLIIPTCLNCKKSASPRSPWRARNFKFCNSQCENELTYNKFIAEWKSGAISGYRKGGYVSHHIRKYLISNQGEKCLVCGWAKTNPYTGKIPLVLDHIDGNSQNCKEENLRLICNNCDSLTSTFKGANKGSGRVSRGNHVYAPKGYKNAI